MFNVRISWPFEYDQQELGQKEEAEDVSSEEKSERRTAKRRVTFTLVFCTVTKHALVY